MAVSRFFKKPTLKEIAINQGACKTYINNGLEQFHALAVALFDAFKSGPRSNETVLKNFLDRFYTYNTKLISNLYHNSRKSELIEGLAFLLRQIVVDEILAHPLQYRAAFDAVTEQTPIALFRQHSVLPPSIFAAATAKALGTKCTLVKTEHNKELGAREVYDFSVAKMPNFDLVIQVQGSSYVPKVWDQALHNYYSYLPVKGVASDAHIEDDSTTLDSILKQIEADKQRIMHTYQQSRANLVTMFRAEELSELALRDLCCQFLPHNNPLNTNVSEFFAKLEPVNKTMSDPKETFGLEELFVREYIECLSRLISIGQINSNDLFNTLENNLVKP